MKKEASWDDCIESNSSISITQDKAKAKSLLDTALGRNLFLSKNMVNKNTANYIFEGYYSSVLENLHALILLDGYKVKNHICLGYYLRDILNENDLFLIFDDCRFKRNSLIYYGRKMDLETSKQAIKRCKELIQSLNKIIKVKLEQK